jgi:hypothetical protein
VSGAVVYPFSTPSGQEPEPDVRARELSDGEQLAVLAVGVATLLLGVVGLANSFAAVAAAAEPTFGRLAWTVPIGIDIGILVFTCLDLVLARLDMRVAWLRLVPWSLVGVTVYLNIAEQHDWFGRVAHAALPLLWVVAVEVATHAVRVRAGLASAKRMDAIRWTRWLLAPLPTLLLWRRMVLWEIRSYKEALVREKTRQLALTELQDRYGHIRVFGRTWRLPIAWRWRAPRRERALYRLGELTPATPPAPIPAGISGPEAHADTAVDTTADMAADVTTELSGVSVRTRRRTPRTTARTAGRPRGTDTATAIAELKAAHPDMTTSQIAERLGVSDRTVRRHLAATREAADTSDPTNPAGAEEAPVEKAS